MTFDSWRKKLWQDYYIWGFAFAVLLSLIEYRGDGYAQAIVVAIFFIASGFISNLISLSLFVRRYWILLVVVVLWIMHFCIIDRSLSVGMPITSLCVIFAGYCVATEGRKSFGISISKLCGLIGVFMILAVLWQLAGRNSAATYFDSARIAMGNFSTRWVGVYVHPVPAACVYLLFTLLCYLFIKNKYLRFIYAILGIVSLWVSASRTALGILVAIMILYFIVGSIRGDLKGEDEPRTSRADKGILALAIVLCGVAIVSRLDSVLFFIKQTIGGFLNTGKYDANLIYRMEAWKHITSVTLSGSIGEVVFGRGYMASAEALSSVPEIAGAYGTLLSGVKNMYISMLYDYGIIGLLLVVAFIVSLLIYYIKGEDVIQRRVGLTLVALLAVGFTFDIQYWNSTSFIIFTMIGSYFGVRDLCYEEKRRKELSLKPSLKVAMYGQKNTMTTEGGVEVVTKELAMRLVEKGDYVTCYNRKGHHVSGAEYDVPMVDEWEGISMKYVPIIEKKGLAALTSSFGAAFACMVGDYDVVHVHAEGPAISCWIPKLTGKRVICHVHGLDHQRVKWGKAAKQIILWGEENAVNFADEIIVLSKGVQDYFTDKYDRNTRFIPNGVNRPKTLPANEITEKWGLKKDNYILFLGRLVPEKGIEYLIRAYKELDTDKKLVIAGGSSDTDSFVGTMKNMSSNDERIIFTGFVDGSIREELYSNAYIYILPSDVEGMPLSLLEALSFGNCCLVSDIDECAEVVEDKGVTFRHSDIQDLKDKLEELIRNPEAVKQYGDEAADFVCGKYNWDKITDEVERLYRNYV